jgi:formylglycine-generating enzyme required for sulfatase activity
VAVGRDIRGNVIVIQAGAGLLDSERFWQLLGGQRPSEDLVEATKRYLEYLLDYYCYLDLRGMGVSDRVPLRLPLLEMYVPLKARLETPEGETWARDIRLAGREPTAKEMEDMGRRLSDPRPVLDLLRNHDGLVLLGDPGAGKTTFLKFLTVALATGQGEALGLGMRLPMLLPLAAYANALAAEDVPLDRFFTRYYEKDRGIGLPLESMLARSLRQGKLLFLLDGLDEVRDQERRHLVVNRVKEFYSLHHREGNKFVLTSRIVGYREVRPEVEDLIECTLVDFDDQEIDLFLDKWTASLEKAARGKTHIAAFEAKIEKDELLAAVYTNSGVRLLAANPLLLTILALMKRQGVTLPERRVELYKTYVDTLLKHWNLARSLAGRSGRDLDVVEMTKILAPLALWMHQVSPGVGLVKEGDLHRQLERIYRERGHENPADSAQRFLKDVRDHSALLLDRGGRYYGFIHLTFQEYLAAVALAQRGQQGVGPIAEALAAHIGEASWHEVSLLTIGYLGVVQQWDEVASAVVESLLDEAPGEPGEVEILIGQAVADASPGGVTEISRRKVVEALLATMRDDHRVSAVRRAAAGKVLVDLGDPRPEVMTVDGMQFCRVPAGPFQMGSDDPKAMDYESPRHECDLPYDFEIGRYPVTVAQFREHMEASGQQPQYTDSLNGIDNEPVVLVTWYEAVAFCRWLTERWRQVGRLEADWVVTLPSEAEWEKAARGTDGRTYPWGEDANPEKANFDETGIGRVSAVGCFPGGGSPCDCEEMSGNLWEWTRSLWGEDRLRPQFTYPYDKEGGRELLTASSKVLRVLRGGSYFRGSWFVGCAVRGWGVPDGRYSNIGFRVVLSPFSSGLRNL